MSKLALSALILGILALFSYVVASPPTDVPADPTELRAASANNPREAISAEKKHEGPSADSVAIAGTDLQRLSEGIKSNTDKITALRSDLLKQIQDLKTSSDHTAQSLLGQINALKSEQARAQQASKDAEDKASQGMKAEIAAAQAKLVAQVDTVEKANVARFDALGQRVDTQRKDFDDVKNSFEEDRRNTSSISPGVALVVALAALVLGPFVAYQFLANQLAGLRREDPGATAALQPTPEVGPDLPQSSSDPKRKEGVFDHEAPPLFQESSVQHETGEERPLTPQPEEADHDRA